MPRWTEKQYEEYKRTEEEKARKKEKEKIEGIKRKGEKLKQKNTKKITMRTGPFDIEETIVVSKLPDNYKKPGKNDE